MVFFRRTLSLSLSLFLFLCSAQAEELSPSADSMKAEISKLWLRFNKGKGLPDIRVRQVMSCYPIANGSPNNRICLVDMNAPDGSFDVQEVPIKFGSNSFEVLEPKISFSPACPNGDTAKLLLRKTLRDNSVEIFDQPEEGVFTTERGRFREKKGPKTLMCSYGVRRSFAGEQTLVSYFSRRGAEYEMESSYELWDD